MKKIKAHRGYTMTKASVAGQFMVLMAVFVVLLGGVVVILAETATRPETVLNAGTERLDAVDEASKSLDMVGNVNAKSDLDTLDADISGL